MQNPGMQTSGASGSDIESARERAQAGIDRAASSAHQTVDRLASAALSTKDRLLATGEQWYAQGQRGIEYSREAVRANPLAAVGIALAAGYIISRLTSSRH